MRQIELRDRLRRLSVGFQMRLGVSPARLAGEQLSRVSNIRVRFDNGRPNAEDMAMMTNEIDLLKKLCDLGQLDAGIWKGFCNAEGARKVEK